jgi:alpha-beta hydrolase superfamily lysophospholipase
VILYGHSLGGILVLYYGLKQKPEVKGILATAPGLHNGLEKQPVKIFAAKLLGTIMPGLSMPTGLDVNAISQDRSVVELYKNDPLVHGKMSVGFGKIMLGIIKWTLNHAGEFSLPLFLIHGELDTIGYPSSSTDFASLVKENCQVVIWEGGYHELHNEPFKEEVFKTMIKWMDELI